MDCWTEVIREDVCVTHVECDGSRFRFIEAIGANVDQRKALVVKQQLERRDALRNALSEQKDLRKAIEQDLNYHQQLEELGYTVDPT